MKNNKKGFMNTIKVRHIASIVLSLALFLPCLSQTYKEGAHLPLQIIIEQGAIPKEIEDPSMNDFGAMTETLDEGIVAQNAAILVSKRVLYNFVARKQDRLSEDHPENMIFNDTPFSKKEWELYTPTEMSYFTNDNQLYLLIPLAQKNSLFTKDAFKLSSFKKLDLLPSENNGDYMPLIDLLKPTGQSSQSKNPKNLTKDLEHLFTTPPPEANGPVFDIILSGHGSPKPNQYIANLSPAEIQEFLSFLNKNIQVGVFMITSCYSGGENIRSLQFKQDINNDKVFFPLNFIIIVNSVGDVVRISHGQEPHYATGKPFFIGVFDIMQNLGKDAEHSIKKLLQAINDQYPTSEFLHGQTNIPQIILPGGINIQSLTPDDAVMVLGNVKARIAEIEKKPIKVYPYKVGLDDTDLWLNLLVYPQAINTPLLMRASHLNTSLYEIVEAQWKNIPTLSEIVQTNEEMFAKDPSLSPYLETLKNADYLYPNIISMIHGNVSHSISKIVFEGDVYDGSGGVLKGMRDSFFDLGERPTIKTFYIDTIEGANDISLLLKASRAVADISEPHPLEALLPQNDKSIILRNVSITTSYEGKLKAVIKFQLDKTAWEFVLDDSLFSPEVTEHTPGMFWDFKKIDAATYEKEFQQLKREVIRGTKHVTSSTSKAKKR